MSKKKYFDQLVEQCMQKEQYMGLGNPMSNILFIGKESGFDPTSSEKMQAHKANAQHLQHNYSIYAQPYIPESNLRNYGHTWQKYQKLYDIIKERTGRLPDYEIDFVSEIFTTELSDLPYPNTKDAKQQANFKAELQERKRTFFDSDFIRSFQVVVIAALDAHYIKNIGTGESREIDNIFGVAFQEEVKAGNGKNKFWVHYGNDFDNQPKLLIHTRQFTNGASNDLLESIGKTIQKFMSDNNISFTV